ncbi:hypothetical protein [Arenibaculum pallidiluteum]|uniref:hypothetical protein n=1 Tax=Arenibaculum pallidiluteum TaxID=2812559 RepID=UPI001A979098|nr:hypothetical protein [Arenibaculum pallidiluteum]
MTGRLAALVAAELADPAPDAARAVGSAILDRHGASVAAILFYGSCLRTGDTSGLLDFYVLTDSLRTYHGRFWPALLNALLPPSVSYLEVPWDGGVLRAKVAVMETRAFARAVRGDGIDTTIWARFCQPVALVHARDEAASAFVVDAIAAALAAAAGWAVRLGPDAASPAGYWTGLFRSTYGAELRAERGNRPDLIYGWAAERYDGLLPAALEAAGVRFAAEPDGRIRPQVAARGRALRGWRLRRRAGKLLNLMRLAKAAFTFENGVDYILWKLERHAGRPIAVTPWQRRHPLLAAPALLWRLYRDGVIR